MIFRRSLIAFQILLLAALGAAGQEKRKTPVQIKPGQTVSGSIRFDRGSASFEIGVPETAFAIKLVLSQASADLDLVLKRKDETVASRETADRNEEILFTRLSDPPLRSGRYTVEVKYPFSFPPLERGKAVASASFKLSYSVFSPGTLPLVPGIPRAATLKAGEKCQGFEIDVPEGTRYLRFDLFDSTGDLDLWASRKEQPIEAQAAEYRSESTLSRETILIGDGGAALKPGRCFLTVIEPSQNNRTDTFSVVASYSAAAPAMLLDIPALPEPKTPMENVLRSTVEIHSGDAGGSGCLLSASGYVLTNLHVVGDAESAPGSRPVIAVNVRDDLPPLELFKAEVVRFDAKRDLALLKITSGLYDQPLPRNYRFPAVQLGDVSLLSIGDALGFFGYPSIGGTGSRVTITYSRGVLSGFDRTEAGMYMKTDGQINEGNSGGAAVNQKFELIGLPTEIVGNGGGRIGYITPVSMIPEEWLTIIRGR